jgi:ligand-binding SRPBCC domain-containing protein
MRHTFEASQWVPYPPAQVFAFFSDPRNLPPLMPAWQKARIEHAFLAAPPLSLHQWNGTTRTAGSGSVLTITFRAVPFVPIRLRWVAVISEFQWNDHFCDFQKSGPLAYWHHCHHISGESRDGVPGTSITDKVTYALPLGPLGDMANGVAIKRQMKSTFAYRQRQVLKLLAAKS